MELEKTGLNSEVVLILGGLNSDILLYLNNDDLISSFMSVKYKHYIPMIIAKQYGYTESMS